MLLYAGFFLIFESAARLVVLCICYFDTSQHPTDNIHVHIFHISHKNKFNTNKTYATTDQMIYSMRLDRLCVQCKADTNVVFRISMLQLVFQFFGILLLCSVCVRLFESVEIQNNFPLFLHRLFFLRVCCCCFWSLRYFFIISLLLWVRCACVWVIIFFPLAYFYAQNDIDGCSVGLLYSQTNEKRKNMKNSFLDRITFMCLALLFNNKTLSLPVTHRKRDVIL